MTAVGAHVSTGHRQSSHRERQADLLRSLARDGHLTDTELARGIDYLRRARLGQPGASRYTERRQFPLCRQVSTAEAEKRFAKAQADAQRRERLAYRRAVAREAGYGSIGKAVRAGVLPR